MDGHAIARSPEKHQHLYPLSSPEQKMLILQAYRDKRAGGQAGSRHLFCVAVHQDDMRVKDGNPLL